jgi:hypothetical protein
MRRRQHGETVVGEAQRRPVPIRQRRCAPGSHFRCDINDLGAESAKPSEDFGRVRRHRRAHAPDPRQHCGIRAPLQRQPGDPHHESSLRRGEHRVRGRVVAGLGALGVLGSLLAAGLGCRRRQLPHHRSAAQPGHPGGAGRRAAVGPGANAPESHTVQRGDTLWDISKLFLKSPWRWPQLWGMNMEQIRNPHLIYPGQVLVLVKSDGRAMLKVAQDARPVQHRQAVAARAQRAAGQRRHRLHSAAPDRPVPERSRGLRHRRAGARAAHRGHAGRPGDRLARRNRLRARRPGWRARLPPVPRTAAAARP